MPQTPPRARPAPSLGTRPFSCVRSDESGVASVTVCGELDVATRPQVDRLLRQAQSEAPIVALDLCGLDFIDSQGAQLVVDGDQRARGAGGRLMIIRGAEASWFFELVGLDFLEFVDPCRRDPPPDVQPPSPSDHTPGRPVTSPRRAGRPSLRV